MEPHLDYEASDPHFGRFAPAASPGEKVDLTHWWERRTERPCPVLRHKSTSVSAMTKSSMSMTRSVTWWRVPRPEADGTTLSLPSP